MIQNLDNLKYNPVRDITAVDQFGFVNLIECLSNGDVPTTISNTEMEYNDIYNPSDIYGKPSDIFEAYRMNDYIKTAGKVKTEITE